MSGIAKIQQQRDDYRSGASTTFTPGKEVWLKDGDQLFLSCVATGEAEDPNLEEYYMYTFRKDNRWTNVLRDDSVDQSEVPDDVRPSHKFAVWAYVHEIIHLDKRSEDWEVVSGPGNKQLFKEVVEDFRIISLGFGRSDYVWNQFVEVFDDWGSLDKGVIRIKRSGAGIDTAYSITATTRSLEIPNEKQDEVDELGSVREYLLERYGGEKETASAGASSSDGEKLGDLF
tara:strand:+ start:4096 stop:4782 length:687 start_codon:yes stop_codon:yes gene_type:complete